MSTEYTKLADEKVNEVVKAGEKCRECGGSGTVNAYDGPDWGSNSAENWPAPCPECYPAVRNAPAPAPEAEPGTTRTGPGPGVVFVEGGR